MMTIETTSLRRKEKEEEVKTTVGKEKLLESVESLSLGFASYPTELYTTSVRTSTTSVTTTTGNYKEQIYSGIK